MWCHIMFLVVIKRIFKNTNVRYNFNVFILVFLSICITLFKMSDYIFQNVSDYSPAYMDFILSPPFISLSPCLWMRCTHYLRVNFTAHFIQSNFLVNCICITGYCVMWFKGDKMDVLGRSGWQRNQLTHEIYENSSGYCVFILVSLK